MSRLTICVDSHIPPKKVNLSAHETHKQSQDNAGVDLNADPLTPLEMSLAKDRREKESYLQQQNGRLFAHSRVVSK